MDDEKVLVEAMDALLMELGDLSIPDGDDSYKYVDYGACNILRMGLAGKIPNIEPRFQISRSSLTERK